ncbi:hypothetical protein [Pontiella sulfatireligans]|uniref:Uncharacterized protein n=1 Tax=Pontiella sulfatireligans TaxID=2750658 RepID=A0A6C2UQ25_9BACT|nr:hypothetical protein [Pontiella sulfatireligans]VGO22308.1 hypothetical protein SCARR_04390 [Pontiella sulfatireligans]
MMVNQVVVLDAAASDLAQGVDFYETQKTGLGAYFFDSLIADLESLEISAGVHAICFGPAPNALQAVPIRDLLQRVKQSRRSRSGAGYA